MRREGNQNNVSQTRQCLYNVILRHVSATIVVVGRQ